MPNVPTLIVCTALRRATFMHYTTVVTRTYVSRSSSALIATGPALHRSILLQADFSCFLTRTPRAISQLLPRQRLKGSLFKVARMTGKASRPHRDFNYVDTHSFIIEVSDACMPSTDMRKLGV